MARTDLLGDLARHVAELEETKIVEIFLYGMNKPDLVPLWFGEGDEPTPAFIGEAAYKSLQAGETFYSNQNGLPETREALAAYTERHYGIGLGLDRFTVTPSGMGAIALAMQMLIDPGDEVVVVGPVWPNIYSSVKVHHGVVRDVAIRLGPDGWTLDVDELVDAIGPKTKAVFINSPGNPTGWVMEQDEQRRVLEAARRHGAWIISDEVYHRLVFDRAVAPSFLSVADPEDRLIVVHSFSKSWMMTGWRLGWMVHPASVQPTLAKLVQISTSGTPVFLQRGGIAALTEGEPTVERLIQRCREARDIVFDRLEAWPRIRAIRPKGGFYAFFAVDGEPDSLALCKRMIDQSKVATAPGIAFGPSGEGYVRLCFAAQTETVRKAMDRLEPLLGTGSRQAAE